MLGELVLASISAPLAFGATVDWTEIELKQLIDSMNSCFMADTIRLTLESCRTAQYSALDRDWSLSRYGRRGLHSLGCWAPSSKGSVATRGVFTIDIRTRYVFIWLDCMPDGHWFSKISIGIGVDAESGQQGLGTMNFCLVRDGACKCGMVVEARHMAMLITGADRRLLLTCHCVVVVAWVTLGIE
jgi:hypothetical protein